MARIISLKESVKIIVFIIFPLARVQPRTKVPHSPSRPLKIIRTRTPILTALALTALARQASGIITISSDGINQSAPANGAPWDYVAELSDGFGPRASGVYLGNGYILTANHIDTDINSVFLDNVTYGVDSSFTPVAISGTDMRIIKLSADPGVPWWNTRGCASFGPQSL